MISTASFVIKISIFSHDCECKLPPYYAPLPYYAVFKALFFNLGTRAIKGMTVGKGLNTVQIFKGHLRREGIIPELIIYTVFDISLELKS